MAEGESPEAALVRELREELGIDATVTGEPVAHVRGADFRMDVFVVEQWAGTPENLATDEHDDLASMTAEELLGPRLADPRIPALIRFAIDAAS